MGGFRVGDSAPSGGWPNGSRDPLTPLSVVIAVQTNPLGSPLVGVDGPAASLPDPPLLPPRLLCCYCHACTAWLAPMYVEYPHLRLETHVLVEGYRLM